MPDAACTGMTVNRFQVGVLDFRAGTKDSTPGSLSAFHRFAPCVGDVSITPIVASLHVARDRICAAQAFARGAERAIGTPRKGAPAPTDADDRFDDSRHPPQDARLQRQAGVRHLGLAALAIAEEESSQPPLPDDSFAAVAVT